MSPQYTTPVKKIVFNCTLSEQDKKALRTKFGQRLKFQFILPPDKILAVKIRTKNKYGFIGIEKSSEKSDEWIARNKWLLGRGRFPNFKSSTEAAVYLDERIITEILKHPDNFFSRSTIINFNFLPDEETLKKLYGKGIKRINYLHRPDLLDLYRTMKMQDQKAGAQQSTDQQSTDQQGGASDKKRGREHDRMMKGRKNHKHGQDQDQDQDQDQMDEQDEHDGGSTHRT